jgi:ATP-dependent Lhr-like helicase
LIECAALLRSIRCGELDAIVHQDTPLDVLAQQIVAEAACREYAEDELYELVTRAWPYRALSREDFDAVVQMAAEGFSTRRGRRAALLHRDEINRSVRGRRGARLLALTSGGAIPEIADYRVVLEPDDTFIGTLNEDFALESMAGDVFQLGNASWLVLQVGAGTVRVADAKGAPPNIPFWLGEAPARSDELSRAVSDLRAEVETRLPSDATDWLQSETGFSRPAAEQAVEYLAEGRRALGVIPTQQTLVLERFFDEAGGMQLVLHAPFGSRINKAWGLALRKRFCRQFNFELQAAATDEGLLLSLGPQHSFPLADVFRYLHAETARDILVQAFLDAPVFQTRWRWNTTIALAVPRNRGGRKLAAQVQRMLAEDLMAAVFPDAAACLENIPGDRQIPDHPLVKQTVKDCLQEAMDFDGLRTVLDRIHGGELRLIARDTPEPSCFTHEILNARPYAFLDDAPLEERRAHAVQTRRAGEPTNAADLGALDPAAIDRVRGEARPEPRDAWEMHDALLTAGFLLVDEVGGPACLDELASANRAARIGLGENAIWIAAERLGELRAIHADIVLEPKFEVPPRLRRDWTRSDAIRELFRSRLTLLGPVRASELAESLHIAAADADEALLALESEGVVLRGRFTPAADAALEWCDRTLLSRIHRYTLNRLRAEIEPVTVADFMRFLFRWQHADPSCRLTGLDGLREVVSMLDGFELAAGAWERSVLGARVDGYEPSLLDMLCLAGEVCWGRLSMPAAPNGGERKPIAATPIALYLREHADAWQTLRSSTAEVESTLSESARRVLATLRTRGASFFNDLMSACRMDADEVRESVGALVLAGLAASDGFSGLRSLVWSSRDVPASRDRRTQFSGRWTAVVSTDSDDPKAREAAVELQAWTLLRRYGVVFRRLLVRETNPAPWRELARIYRRLEARGEIRGGRFVSGMSGEQFALPYAIDRLREVRRQRPHGGLIAISTADPLNLVGIITAGDRIRASRRNRLVYRDGVPLAVLEADSVRELSPIDPSIAADVSRALQRPRTFAATIARP